MDLWRLWFIGLSPTRCIWTITHQAFLSGICWPGTWTHLWGALLSSYGNSPWVSRSLSPHFVLQVKCAHPVLALSIIL